MGRKYANNIKGKEKRRNKSLKGNERKAVRSNKGKFRYY